MGSKPARAPAAAALASALVFVAALSVGAPASAAPAYLWRAATGGQIRSRPAVGPDGTVYALSEDSYLYAWVPGGSLKWKHDLGWIPWDCLAVGDDGTIYAGLKNGDFLAVNPRGGRLWTVRLDGLPSGDPAISRDGTVVVGTSAGTLTALSHLGRREWSVTLPGPVRGSAVIDGAGTIYAAAADRRLYALTPWGEFKWSLPFPSPPQAPAIAANAVLAVGTDGGELAAVSPTGNVQWKVDLGAPIAGAAALAAQVVAVTTDGKAAGFSLDGKKLWAAAADGRVSLPPVAGSTGALFTTDDGSLFHFDPSNGSSVRVRPGAAGPMVVTAQGTVLVGGRDWIVYAFDPGSAGLPALTFPPSAPWPEAGHDERHSGRTDAASADNRPLLESDPDYLYLQGLLGAGGREGVQLYLAEIERRAASGSLAGSRWFIARQLEGVVGSGLITQVRQNLKLVNDFPDLRAQAADLLAQFGSIGSRAALLRTASAETDGVALAAEIHALGALASDGDGASVAAIVRALSRPTAGPPDLRVASAAVDALGRIARYEGTLDDPSAISALIAVSGGPYDEPTRAAADAILHGDLKAYIFQ